VAAEHLRLTRFADITAPSQIEYADQIEFHMLDDSRTGGYGGRASGGIVLDSDVSTTHFGRNGMLDAVTETETEAEADVDVGVAI